MLRKSLWCVIVLAAFAYSLPAATFGTVVSIGGQSADLAIDESRGVLYVANFTANRIEVVSLANYSVQTSINVAPQPSSLALSPDSRYLVITHFGNFAAPTPSNNSLTVIDLTTNGQQTFALDNPPLGVAFGIDGRALVVTTTDYILFDPVLGTTTELGTISGVAANTLPVAPANFPPQITTASMSASGDGLTIYGMGGSTATFTFKYDVTSQTVRPGGIVTTSGQIGPIVVSGNQDGSRFMAGWTMIDQNGTFINYFPAHSNQYNIGTTLFDSTRGLLYSQIPVNVGDAPVLRISDVDNLTIEGQLQLPENTTGKSVLSSDGKTMFSVSSSGVLVLPVGSLAQTSRLAAGAEDLIFLGSFCNQNVSTQSLTITDPGGGSTAFSIASDTAGVTVYPTNGITPATVSVSVDPTAFSGQTGTVTAHLALTSRQAVNLPPTVRVLINTKSPDQRGTIVDIPGTLVDVLPDPSQNRFYVLRQDRNEVLVYDGSNYTKIATLRSGNLPSSMAISFDRQSLLVGNAGSQIVSVFDLGTLQPTPPILLPSGHIALSLASSANATLAATEFYDGTHHIVRLDLNALTGSEPASLGVFNNVTANDVALVASSNGSSIMGVGVDGSTLLYDAVQDTFTVSRQDFTALSGAYAASAFGQYVVGSNLLNSSLVPVQQFETQSGASSGFAFVDQFAFRTTVPVPSSTTGTGTTGTTTTSTGAIATSANTAAGTIETVSMAQAEASLSLATRMAEAPLTGSVGVSPSVFSRTVAPLYSRTAVVNLTVSGVTVLAWDYAASVAPPQLTKVVNAADFSSNLAPGGLISIFGSDLSPVNLATQEIPLPTALGDSCLTVNGLPVPMLFVSPGQINAEMPFETVGDVTLVLRTPGGVSDNFNLVVLPGAPGVFQSGVAGPETNIPTIMRSDDNQLVTASNPVHKGDTLIIYLTGLGQTNPAMGDGQPGPSSPLAVALNPPTVTLGGVGLSVAFAGISPGEVGVYQINVTVPGGVPQGLQVPLVISQSGASTSIPVRVVN